MRYHSDDFENRRIYEESIRPEGIRKTQQVKEPLKWNDTLKVKVNDKVLFDKKDTKFKERTSFQRSSVQARPAPSKEVQKTVIELAFIIIFMIITFIIIAL